MTAASSEHITEGAMCRPNIGAAGRRRRTQIARLSAVAAVATFVVLVALDVGWPARLLVGLPAAVAIASWLEVRRNTCVLHAAKGTIEGENFRAKRVEEEFAAASRRVARGIWRDTALASTLVSALAAATAFLP